MSIAAAFAADKETPFKAAPAASYEHHQTDSKVTIGIDPYITEEQQKIAFGKVRPTDYGVLPILVVIQNDSDQTIRLDRMKIDFIGPDRQRIESTPAREVRYVAPVRRPGVIPGPAGPVPGRMKKNPLDAWEIEGRAFAAQVLPPGQSASGFFYFQSECGAAKPGGESGKGWWCKPASLTVSGLYEARTGKELLYFEIPLQ